MFYLALSQPFRFAAFCICMTEKWKRRWRTAWIPNLADRLAFSKAYIEEWFQTPASQESTRVPSICSCQYHPSLPSFPTPRAALLWRGEGVQGVLTLFCSGAAQVCHDDRVMELKEQLEMEEEDGDRQEEEEEVESGEASQRDAPMRCIIKQRNKDARAVSLHARHASVEVQVQCVNVVIGVLVVHGELHVVRVVPIVVCDDAVVRRTLVLIALI